MFGSKTDTMLAQIETNTAINARGITMATTYSEVLPELGASLSKTSPTSNVSPTYHPLFSSPDAHIVLRSSEGTHYRVFATTLRTTSGFFHDMLSLPQKHVSIISEDVIALDEPDRVLEQLLRMVSGFAINEWESLDDVEGVLRAAEKYDTPGPLTIIRSAIHNPLFRSNPFWLYAIATNFGWEDEAKIASNLSLSLTIHDASYDGILGRIQSPALRRLWRLHRMRYDEFERLLEVGVDFRPWSSGVQICSVVNPVEGQVLAQSCFGYVDRQPWTNLKLAMIKEMDQRPSGEGLLKMETWPAAMACWAARCEMCNAEPHSRVATLTKVNAVLKLLPATV